MPLNDNGKGARESHLWDERKLNSKDKNLHFMRCAKGEQRRFLVIKMNLKGAWSLQFMKFESVVFATKLHDSIFIFNFSMQSTFCIFFVRKM